MIYRDSIHDSTGTLISEKVFDTDAQTVDGVAATGDDATLLAAYTARTQANTRRTNLDAAISTLRQWADDAENTTVTDTNATATLGVVVTRLGVFFNRFADLLEER